MFWTIVQLTFVFVDYIFNEFLIELQIACAVILQPALCFYNYLYDSPSSYRIILHRDRSQNVRILS
jgi:hypothetical protein